MQSTVTKLDGVDTLKYRYARSVKIPIIYVSYIAPRMPDQINEKTQRDYLSTIRFSSLREQIERLDLDAPDWKVIDDYIEENKMSILPERTSMLYFHILTTKRLVNDDTIVDYLIIINSYYRSRGVPDITILQLRERYKDWLGKWDVSIQVTIDEADYIDRVQSDMLAVKTDIWISPPVYTRHLAEFTPMYRVSGTGREGVTTSTVGDMSTIGDIGRGTLQRPEPYKGLSIFDSVSLSLHVPYVRYRHSDGRDFHKVWDDDTQMFPDMKTVIDVGQHISENTFYITVWTGAGDPKKATKDSFIQAVYSLPKGKLWIDTSVTDDDMLDDVRNFISQSFIGMEIDNKVDTKVGGGMLIIGLEYDLSFFSYILLDDVASRYLFIKENIKPLMRKDVPYYNYRGISEAVNPVEEYGLPYIVNRSMINFELKGYKIDPTLASQLTGDPISGNRLIPMIEISIREAENRLEVFRFSWVLSILLTKYSGRRYSTEAGDLSEREILDHIGAYWIGDIYDDVYETALFDVDEQFHRAKNRVKHLIKAVSGPNRINLDNYVDKMSTRKESRLSYLKRIVPELFSGHGRDLQSKHQPYPVDHGDIDKWLDDGLQVLAFPKMFSATDMAILYRDDVTPDSWEGDDHPDDYWYFICIDSDGRSDTDLKYPGVRKNIGVNKDRYPWMPCSFTKDQRVDGKSFFDLVYYGEHIERSTGIKFQAKTSKILKHRRLGNVNIDIKRVLSDICDTDSDTDFIRVGSYRTINSMIHAVHTAVEGFDVDEDIEPVEIAEMDADEVRERMVFMGPWLCKQELFDISDEIIMEELTNTNKEFDSSKFYRYLEEVYNVNISVFYSPKREKGHEASSVSYIEVPRNRLYHVASTPRRETVILLKHWGSDGDKLDYPQYELIAMRTRRKLQLLFDSDIPMLLNQVILACNNELVWNGTEFLVKSPVVILPEVQLGSFRLVEQVVDSCGKLRAVIVSDGVGRSLFVLHTPLQPLGIPVVKDLQSLAQYSYVPPGLSIVSKCVVDGVIVAVNAMIGGMKIQISGTTVDIRGVSTTTVDTTADVMSGVPIEPLQPLINTGSNLSAISAKLESTMKVILQVLTWLCNVAMISKISSEMLATRLFKVDTSSRTYDLSRLNKVLPPAVSMADALRHLEGEAPSLASNGVIICTSAVLMERWRYYVKQYMKRVEGLDTPNTIEIEGQLAQVLDFKARPSQVVIIGGVELDSWLSVTRMRRDGAYKMKMVIETRFSQYVYPYVYKAVDGRLYMIQNTDTLRQAIALCVRWRTHMDNPGRDIEPHDDPLPPYKLYKVQGAKGIKMEKKPDIPQILRYSNEIYAAILPVH